jgi:hypothetical protein
MMRVNISFKFLMIYFNVETHDIWEENLATRIEIQIETPLHKVLGYKRRSDIKEVDIRTLKCTFIVQSTLKIFWYLDLICLPIQNIK